MTIRGEISTEKIVEFLLYKECQFEVGDGDKKVIVAFTKGDWMVYQKDHRLFIVNDCCDVMEGSDADSWIFKHFIINDKEDSNNYDGRKIPAKGICAVIASKIPLNKDTVITVHQAYRNGHVYEDGELVLGPRYDESLI